MTLPEFKVAIIDIVWGGNKFDTIIPALKKLIAKYEKENHYKKEESTQ